jgi:hypothetical protein
MPRLTERTHLARGSQVLRRMCLGCETNGNVRFPIGVCACAAGHQPRRRSKEWLRGVFPGVAHCRTHDVSFDPKPRLPKGRWRRLTSFASERETR